MIDLVFAWAFMALGSMVLLRLTWQDLFNNRMVDQRQVYFILGMSSLIVVVSMINVGAIYVTIAIVLSVLVGGFCSKTMGLGIPDTQLISCFFLLFSMAGFWLSSIFTATLLITSLLYYAYNKLLCKTLPQPYLPVILISWTLTWVVFYNPQIMVYLFSFLPFKLL